MKIKNLPGYTGIVTPSLRNSLNTSMKNLAQLSPNRWARKGDGFDPNFIPPQSNAALEVRACASGAHSPSFQGLGGMHAMGKQGGSKGTRETTYGSMGKFVARMQEYNNQLKANPDYDEDDHVIYGIVVSASTDQIQTLLDHVDSDVRAVAWRELLSPFGGVKREINIQKLWEAHGAKLGSDLNGSDQKAISASAYILSELASLDSKDEATKAVAAQAKAVLNTAINPSNTGISPYAKRKAEEALDDALDAIEFPGVPLGDDQKAN